LELPPLTINKQSWIPVNHVNGLHKKEFEDTKGVIRIRKSKKNRQHNGQMKKVQKDKQRSTKHTHKKLKIE